MQKTEIIYKSTKPNGEIITAKQVKSKAKTVNKKAHTKPPEVKAIAKTAKVTLVVDPSTITKVDSIGFKQTKITINVDKMVFNAMLNSKSYRKAIAAIDELGTDDCNVILQGTMIDPWKLDSAGLVVQPKKVKESEG